MVKTYGLTHLAIGVRDPARAYAFYRAVLGMEAVYTESNFIQAQTPGTRDVLVFERAPARAGRKGGIAHFGFRLTRPEDISKALQAVEAAGGCILGHGEFCPGEPYLFCEDPDGYEVRSGTSCRHRSIQNRGLSEAGRYRVPGAAPEVRRRRRKPTSINPDHRTATDHVCQLRRQLFDHLRTPVKRCRGVVQQDDLPCAVLVGEQHTLNRVHGRIELRLSRRHHTDYGPE